MSPRQPVLRDISIGILCPYCRSREHRVTHKRDLIGMAVRRHRCKDQRCGKTFYTNQVVRPITRAHVRQGFPTNCIGCGQSFIVLGAKVKYCSERCGTQRRNRITNRVRRAQQRLAPHEQVDLMVVFARDGWRCQLCGKSTPKYRRGQRHPDAPELDHIVPLSKGGHHTYINTHCACSDCNRRKGASIIGQLRLSD